MRCWACSMASGRTAAADAAGPGRRCCRAPWVSDLTHHPEDSEQLFAITSNNDGTERNGILRRDARGSWSELGSRTSMMLNKLHVAATPNGLRFYESAIREWP